MFFKKQITAISSKLDETTSPIIDQYIISITKFASPYFHCIRAPHSFDAVALTQLCLFALFANHLNTERLCPWSLALFRIRGHRLSNWEIKVRWSKACRIWHGSIHAPRSSSACLQPRRQWNAWIHSCIVVHGVCFICEIKHLEKIWWTTRKNVRDKKLFDIRRHYS